MKDLNALPYCHESRRARGLARRVPHGGFTMVELMITIAVLAILMSIALPSFRTMVLNSRLSGRIDSLINGLNYARNTALSTNTTVVFCPIGTATAMACGSSWGAGWKVVRPSVSTDTAPLLSSSTPSDGAVLASASASVSFDPLGLAGTLSSFTVCDSRGAGSARWAQVSATGFAQAPRTVLPAAMAC